MRAEATVTIVNKLGLHARAATKLVQLSTEFKSDIILQQGNNHAPADSVLALMMLESSQGKSVTIICEGDDAEQALGAVTLLIQNKFDETE